MAAKPEYVKNNQRIGNAVKLAVVSLQVMSSNKSNKSNLILLPNIINDPVWDSKQKYLKQLRIFPVEAPKRRKVWFTNTKMCLRYLRHACSVLVKYPL